MTHLVTLSAHYAYVVNARQPSSPVATDMYCPSVPPSWLAAPLILLLLSCSLRLTASVPHSREHLAATHDIDRCTIPVLTSCADVARHFPHSPFVLRSLTNHSHFTALTSREALLSHLASSPITLASANTYSHDRRTVPFDSYLASLTNHTVSLDESADATWYFFGDHDDPASSTSAIARLLGQYGVPALYYGLESCDGGEYDVVEQPVSRYSMRLSIGLGGRYSGTPFHYHSSVFAHVLHGSKRWLLYPPTHTPPAAIVRPDMSAIQWMDEMWLGDGLDGAEAEDGAGSVRDGVLGCVCGAGDVLYLPDGWLHMTLNMAEYNVFVSSFVYDKGEDWEDRQREWTSKYGALQR